MNRLALVAAACLLLAGCSGSSDKPDAATLAKRVGCPGAKVSTTLQSNEPQRDERVDCHGLTVVTFKSTDDRDAYLAMSKAANEAFGQDFAATTGDDWLVMGTSKAVAQVKPKLS